MGSETSIAWTNHSYNPWWGCQRVSPGCERCYAEAFSKRVGLTVWGPKTERRFFGDKHWREPLRWNRHAKAAGERRRVFCASMADVFEDREDLVEPRARLFRLIEECTDLDWLLLTKRPENVRRHAVQGGWHGSLPKHVWLGTTAENQEYADKRIPELLKVPASVHFVSYEPALGPLTLSGAACDRCFRPVYAREDDDGGEVDGAPMCQFCTHEATFDWFGLGLSWVIIGGESGGHARPFNLAWARDVIDECEEADAACFMKQVGARTIDTDCRVGTYAPEDKRSIAAAKALDFGTRTFNLVLTHDGKGGDPAEWPEDLRVREFPA